MNNEIIKEFLELERDFLSKPKTFFPVFEAGLEGRSKIIWQEYLEWQKIGGKIKKIQIKELDNNSFCWKVGDEHLCLNISFNVSKESCKNAIRAVYSFLEDRPQYFKFRKMEGMFNPLQLLFYEFIDPNIEQ